MINFLVNKIDLIWTIYLLHGLLISGHFRSRMELDSHVQRVEMTIHEAMKFNGNQLPKTVTKRYQEMAMRMRALAI